jgi:CHAD domain-containing protein
MSKKAREEFPLCRHLDALVEDLRGFVPEALEKFDSQAIHKARVTTRRLKAALELLETVLKEDHARPFSRLGRKLRRRLGPMRDIDVMLGHLEEITPDSKLAAPADWFRKRLLEDREEQRAESTDKAPPDQILTRLGTWWALRQDVIQADPMVRSLLADSVKQQLEQFAHNAEHLATSHDPHQIRIAGKSLRYTLEMADKEGCKLPKMVLRTFKQMQDRLGVWHDYVVLASRAMQASLDHELPLHDPPMQQKVLEFVEYSMKRAQQEMGKFSKLWMEKGKTLRDAIQEAFVELEDAKSPAVIATPLQTDLDPAHSAISPAPAVASTDPPPAA